MVAQAILVILKNAEDKRYPPESLDWIIHQVIDILIEEEGFRKIEYDVIWAVNGWASFYEEENKQNRDPEIDIIKDIIKEAGFKGPERDEDGDN